jgi:hypothetical protein
LWYTAYCRTHKSPRNMKFQFAVLSPVAFLILVSAAQTFAEPTPQAAPTSAEQGAHPSKRPLLKYLPPKPPGSPGVRIDGDGGSRGTGGKDASIYVLAPGGEALTTQKQPSLFYFQKGAEDAAKGSLILTVVDPARPVPLLKAKAENPEPGFRRVQLARHAVELAPGVPYEWRISFGAEGEGRSAHVFASGVIRRVEASPELVKALAETPANRAEVYARHGIWYDAFEEVSNRILEEPHNREWQRARAALLEQIGLGRILAGETAR